MALQDSHRPVPKEGPEKPNPQPLWFAETLPMYMWDTASDKCLEILCYLVTKAFVNFLFRRLVSLETKSKLLGQEGPECSPTFLSQISHLLPRHLLLGPAPTTVHKKRKIERGEPGGESQIGKD